MNHFIKFRAWDKENKEMLYNILADRTHDCDIYQMCDEMSTGNNDIFEYMQYTTGKDKNGKEVYEHDIVEINGYIGLIEWDNKYLCWVVTWMNNYESEMIEDKNKFEVIGNLNENPELWVEVRDV